MEKARGDAVQPESERRGAAATTGVRQSRLWPVVRFVVRVDPAWLVTVDCPEAAQAWRDAWPQPPRAMTKVDDGAGGYLPAGALHRPGDAHDPAAAVDGASLYAAYAAIVDRQQPDIERFGHYLFDALLGPDLWAVMAQFAEATGKHALEVALELPPLDAHLHRLPWELMRGPTSFLAAGVWNGPVRKLSVALTRLVRAPANLVVPAPSRTPRVLFVVGTDLADEQIRPGAELLGLLRRIPRDRPIRSQLLERASIGVIQAVATEFAPDVVHFICHGGIGEDGTPYLDLQLDQGDEDPRRTAGQLLHALGAAGHLPTVVVLSACYTSSASGREEYVPASADAIAPMATTFIEGGVPIVVGMSGRVSDMTCRLFTRRFGQSIVGGDSIVRATAEARMATFVEGRDPLASPDWALPTVFVADAVTADAPVFPRTEAGDEWRDLEQWITEFGLRDLPVFVGRERYFQEFRDVVSGWRGDGPARPVLAILIEEPGLGGTRLLKELAIAALEAGHVPVRLAPARDRTPTTLEDFARELATAIAANPIARSSKPLQLDLLMEEGARKLDPTLARQLRRDRQVTAAIVGAAAQRDLADLMKRAGRQYGQFLDPKARVVVFMDDLDRYGPDLVRMLTDESGGILGPAGLGSAERPVPVVFTFHKDAAVEALIGSASEPRIRTPWIELTKLTRLGEGEDMLVCSMVLLNPYAPDLFPDDNLSRRAWALIDLGRDEYAKIARGFRYHHRGSPTEIASARLYAAAGQYILDEKFVEADDEAVLRKVQLSGPRR